MYRQYSLVGSIHCWFYLFIGFVHDKKDIEYHERKRKERINGKQMEQEREINVSFHYCMIFWTIMSYACFGKVIQTVQRSSKLLLMLVDLIL